MTAGLLRLGPGPAEARQREHLRQVQQPLASPKTIVVVNPKGGACKTTSTLLLAAQYGLHRGASTLAWDNNETRGTLGWASQPGARATSTIDLLADLMLRGGGHRERAEAIMDYVSDPHLLGELQTAVAATGPDQSLATLVNRPRLSVGDAAGYVRPQPWGHFHVLASPEVDHGADGGADLVGRDGFTTLHEALSDLYEILLIDTGNNIRAANWRAAVDRADQLVVVSTVRESTAQSASWMLDALQRRGRGDLIERSITVLAEPEGPVDRELRTRLEKHFAARTHAVLSVPHDNALVPGGVIHYDALARATREAWLQVAAASAEAL